ncbi:MAG: acetyl-CoA C-acyltransferase, partial [Planctomycetes bacterium]|nr:acetyl-CoA C-acyltransferase [Planctomycetota bacterium]
MMDLNNAPPIVIAAGLRTPWARAGGQFKNEDAAGLAARVARELFARTGIDPGGLDEVIAGSVGPPHDQANVGRVIGLRAGIPHGVPARTVARNCASGIEAVTSAVTAICAGQGDLYLTLGVEVMSQYPLIFGRKMTDLFAKLMAARSMGQRLGAIASFRPSFLKPRVALLEGLNDPTCGLLMGQTAEVIAREFGVSRQDADTYAAESHQRARRARDAGRFDAEILPIHPKGRAGAAVAQDDSIRDNQSAGALAKMRPYFEKPDGVVTVGNACGITDGAGALLITTLDRARAEGLRPLARIRSFAWAGLDPRRMGLGPVYATAKALDLAGCTLADIGAIELNEAFAVQVLACKRAFESREFAREELGRDTAIGEL